MNGVIVCGHNPGRLTTALELAIEASKTIPIIGCIETQVSYKFKNPTEFIIKASPIIPTIERPQLSGRENRRLRRKQNRKK